MYKRQLRILVSHQGPALCVQSLPAGQHTPDNPAGGSLAGPQFFRGLLCNVIAHALLMRQKGNYPAAIIEGRISASLGIGSATGKRGPLFTGFTLFSQLRFGNIMQQANLVDLFVQRIICLLYTSRCV